jgi:hypothetical protein
MEKHVIESAIDEVLKNTKLDPRIFYGRVMEKDNEEIGYVMQCQVGGREAILAEEYGDAKLKEKLRQRMFMMVARMLDTTTEVCHAIHFGDKL